MSDVFRKEYKALSETDITRIDDIKEKAQQLWDSFEWTIGSDKRMMELAKTNLEQSVMWAIKSIT